MRTQASPKKSTRPRRPPLPLPPEKLGFLRRKGQGRRGRDQQETIQEGGWEERREKRRRKKKRKLEDQAP